MAHYAKLSDENIVLTVLAVNDSDCLKNGVEDEETGRAYLENVHGYTNWKKCSYNTYEGVHREGGTPFRGTYPGIGYSYDAANDIFISPQPYSSWVKNVSNARWDAPTPYPNVLSYDDGGVEKQYYISWDEPNTRWIASIDDSLFKVWNGSSWQDPS